jgi:hypothetical protein
MSENSKKVKRHPVTGRTFDEDQKARMKSYGRAVRRKYYLNKDGKIDAEERQAAKKSILKKAMRDKNRKKQRGKK